jgi:hypothetical protein
VSRCGHALSPNLAGRPRLVRSCPNYRHDGVGTVIAVQNLWPGRLPPIRQVKTDTARCVDVASLKDHHCPLPLKGDHTPLAFGERPHLELPSPAKVSFRYSAKVSCRCVRTAAATPRALKCIQRVWKSEQCWRVATRYDKLAADCLAFV